MKQEERIAYARFDHANMPTAVLAAKQADLERHCFTPRYPCSPFDPTELVALSLEQWPDRPEFAEALERCKVQWRKNEFYAYLQEPAKLPICEPFAVSFMLLCPRQGELIIDRLEDGSVSGIEFMEAGMSLRGEGLRVVHRKRVGSL